MALHPFQIESTAQTETQADKEDGRQEEREEKGRGTEFCFGKLSQKTYPFCLQNFNEG